MQDQPFHVLQILLEHPGELVTREELQRQIWPADTFVDFEKGLNNAIKRLRDALGDSAEQPRFIETHSRRGYRFIGSVTAADAAGRKEAGDSAGEAGVSALSRPLYRRLAISAFLLLVSVTILFGLNVGGLKQRWLIKASAPVIHSLAVLPLVNLSNDPNQEYFSDGMTDALITDLAQIGSVKVISRTSVMHYKRTDKTLPEIARELNVDGIVEGTVQRSGDRVRITAQLIQGATDKHLWANTYERDMHDVFALERDVTKDIAHQVESRVDGRRHASGPETLQPANLKALEAYLAGNYQLNRGSGDEGMRKAQEYFQQAIEADPVYAAAYVGMAYSHYVLLRSTPDDRAIRVASAKKAVALDASSSDAWSALGEMKFADWDWTVAEQELRRAIALNPNNAKAHASLCVFLDATLRLDESLGECQMAQQLDPDYDHLSETMEARGQYDQAIGLLRRAIEHHPEDAFLRYFLYRDYALKGMYRESVRELEQSVTLVGRPEIAARVHRAYVSAGYGGALRQWAKELERLHASGQFFLPRLVAEVYAQLGDKDRAFYWLEEGYRQRARIGAYGGLNWMLIEHELDPLRADPRFQDLLRRMNLPVDSASANTPHN